MVVDQFPDIEVPAVFNVPGILAGGFASTGGDTGEKGVV